MGTSSSNVCSKRTCVLGRVKTIVGTIFTDILVVPFFRMITITCDGYWIVIRVLTKFNHFPKYIGKNVSLMGFMFGGKNFFASLRPIIGFAVPGLVDGRQFPFRIWNPYWNAGRTQLYLKQFDTHIASASPHHNIHATFIALINWIAELQFNVLLKCGCYFTRVFQITTLRSPE